MTPELRDSFKIDRTGWEPGPWDSEPDRIDFRHADLPCLMLRNDSGGWCGYAGVPPGHPLYGKNAEAAERAGVPAHREVNYAGACEGMICHVPEPGEPDEVWWFGFDCIHLSSDRAPGFDARAKTIGLAMQFGGTYRDVAYVRGVVQEMAEALAALAQ